MVGHSSGIRSFMIRQYLFSKNCQIECQFRVVEPFLRTRAGDYKMVSSEQIALSICCHFYNKPNTPIANQFPEKDVFR